ncbi:MAG: 1,4-beta-xylanase [Lachnospiraceae bacterium]|nr:1,4-beta-xylanase [Lachnospiraceae bacterium]
MITLPYINGITFAPFAPAGNLAKERARQSLKLMKERTNANFIILVPGGLQETPQSEQIDYTSNRTMTDSELKQMIDYAHVLGLRVALKPTVNCKNGTWRAHINFFDEDVPCEPKWSNWFPSYMEFQNHYAQIAQEMGCEMHIAGCEMVMSERRADEWRQTIAEIRKDFKGLVSYNTDKYQEHNVTWWDCVDVISSSGYYPIDDWDRQLDRIEPVVAKYQKPFFFAEAGCMSVVGSKYVPNDWSVQGECDLEEQADWYKAMFRACKKRSWVRGFALWSWIDNLYEESEAAKRRDYELYAKPAEKVVQEFYIMYSSDSQPGGNISVK